MLLLIYVVDIWDLLVDIGDYCFYPIDCFPRLVYKLMLRWRGICELYYLVTLRSQMDCTFAAIVLDCFVYLNLVLWLLLRVFRTSFRYTFTWFVGGEWLHLGLEVFLLRTFQMYFYFVLFGTKLTDKWMNINLDSFPLWRSPWRIFRLYSFGPITFSKFINQWTLAILTATPPRIS